MTNMPFEFENDHRQYMSLAGHAKAIPLSLELRAKRALAELKDIQCEFDLHQREWDAMVEKREKAFEEAFEHYTTTKDDWFRIPNGGNPVWVKMTQEELLSSIGNEPMPRYDYLPTEIVALKNSDTWPFGDASWTV